MRLDKKTLLIISVSHIFSFLSAVHICSANHELNLIVGVMSLNLSSATFYHRGYFLTTADSSRAVDSY